MNQRQTTYSRARLVLRLVFFLSCFSLSARSADYRCKESFTSAYLDLKRAGSEAAHYRKIKLTDEELRMAKRKLVEWTFRDESVMEIGLGDPMNQLGVRYLVEQSDLPLHYKIAAIEGTKKFAEAGGSIRIDPDPSEPQYYWWPSPKQRPIILLYSLENIKQDVYLHELSHFRDDGHLVENIGRNEKSKEEADRKLFRQLGNRAFRPFYTEWTEDNAVRSESEVDSTGYPYMEKLRSFASDHKFRTAAVNPESPQHRTVQRVMDNLAEIALKKRLAILETPRVDGLSPVDRLYRLEFPSWLAGHWEEDFHTPPTHWKTDEQLAWLRTLKKMYQTDFLPIRTTRAAIAYKKWLTEKGIGDLHPTFSKLLKNTVSWCRLDPNREPGRENLEAFRAEIDKLSRLTSYRSDPDIQRLNNVGRLNLPRYEQEIQVWLQGTFPDEKYRAWRERILPYLMAPGIMACPDYKRSFLPARPSRIEAFMLRAASELDWGNARGPWTKNLRQLAHDPAVGDFVRRTENLHTLSGFRRLGVPVSESFWRGFPTYLRTRERSLALREMFAETDWETRALPAFENLARTNPRWEDIERDLLLAAEQGRVKSRQKKRIQNFISNLRSRIEVTAVPVNQ